MTPMWCHVCDGPLLVWWRRMFMLLDGCFEVSKIIGIEHVIDLSGWTFLAGFRIWAGSLVSSRGQQHPWVTGHNLTFNRALSALDAAVAASVAAAGPYHHVLVFLQNDVGVVIEVKHWDGMEFGGGTAGLGYILRVHQVHLKSKRNTLGHFKDQ